MLYHFLSEPVMRPELSPEHHLGEVLLSGKLTSHHERSANRHACFHTTQDHPEQFRRVSLSTNAMYLYNGLRVFRDRYIPTWFSHRLSTGIVTYRLEFSLSKVTELEDTTWTSKDPLTSTSSWDNLVIPCKERLPNSSPLVEILVPSLDLNLLEGCTKVTVRIP